MLSAAFDILGGQLGHEKVSKLLLHLVLMIFPFSNLPVLEVQFNGFHAIIKNPINLSYATQQRFIL